MRLEVSHQPAEPTVSRFSTDTQITPVSRRLCQFGRQELCTIQIYQGLEPCFYVCLFCVFTVFGGISMEDKTRVSLYLDEDYVKKIDTFMKNNHIKSRSDFFRMAGDHMIAYSEIQNNDELVNIVNDAMGIIAEKNSTTLAKSLFRYAVNLEMVARMLARFVDLTDKDLERYRKEAINNVRRTRGRIKIQDIVKGYYNESEDELKRQEAIEKILYGKKNDSTDDVPEIEIEIDDDDFGENDY